MAEDSAGSYWAQKTAGRSASEFKAEIFKVAVTEGDQSTSYACTGNVKVTLTATEGTMGEVLQEGDAKLHLYGLAGTDVDTPIDLKSGLTENTVTKPFSFDITGNTDKTITASVELINKSTTQNHLADKELEVKIDVEGTQCAIKPAD